MKIPHLLAAAIALNTVHAQQEADPFRNAQSPPAARVERGPTNISICYETFSLPLALAAGIQREAPGDGELYARMVAEVEKGVARQESFSVLRARSGQKATTESISELIYPIGWKPPEVPNSVGVAVTQPKTDAATAAIPAPAGLEDAPPLAAFSGIQTPSAPDGFETRNVGSTFEISPTAGEDQKFIDLRMVPERVTLVGRAAWGQGLAKAEMPIFESQRVNTSATLHVGEPFLIGTVSRPPVSEVDEDSANRVWFAFVTATFAKP